MIIETVPKRDLPYKREFELGTKTVLRIHQRTHKLLKLVAENEAVAAKTGWFGQMRREAKYGWQFDHLNIGFLTPSKDGKFRRSVLRGRNSETLFMDVRYIGGQDAINHLSLYSGSTSDNRFSLDYDQALRSLNGMLWLPHEFSVCFFNLSAEEKPEVRVSLITDDYPKIIFEHSRESQHEDIELDLSYVYRKPDTKIETIKSFLEAVKSTIDMKDILHFLDTLNSAHVESLTVAAFSPNLGTVWTQKDEEEMFKKAAQRMVVPNS